jgi:hypothetical protein
MADRRYALIGHQHNNVEVIAPTLLNSWANFAGYQESGYWVDSHNVVHLHGVIEAGADGSIIMELPEGLRPAARQIFAAMSYNGSAYQAARIDVTADGEVYFFTTTATWAPGDWVSLSGITFLAE